MGSALESTDMKNKLEDLSGVAVKPGENPYDALIEVCHGDPVECPLSSHHCGACISHGTCLAKGHLSRAGKMSLRKPTVR